MQIICLKYFSPGPRDPETRDSYKLALGGTSLRSSFGTQCRYSANSVGALFCQLMAYIVHDAHRWLTWKQHFLRSTPREEDRRRAANGVRGLALLSNTAALCPNWRLCLKGSVKAAALGIIPEQSSRVILFSFWKIHYLLLMVFKSCRLKTCIVTRVTFKNEIPKITLCCTH